MIHALIGKYRINMDYSAIAESVI